MFDFEQIFNVPIGVILDISVSIMCGFLGLCLTTLFIYTSPKRKLWINFPNRTRRPILVAALFFLWRCANLSYLAPTSTGAGHINAEGFMLTLALTWLAVEVVLFVLREKLKDSLWERITWMLNIAHTKPELAEIAVTAAAVDEAKQLGIKVFEPQTRND